MIKKKFAFLAVFLFFVAIITSACGGGGKTTPPSYPFIPVPTPSPTVSPTPTPILTPEKYPLELSDTEFTVNIGETTNITVTLNGEDITQTATYTVDQEAIATVEGGLITGVSLGVATVTVNAENAESEKTFTVNVIDPTLPSLEVSPMELYLGIDEEATVAVTLEGKDVTEDVTYTSDDESIATAEKGTVKGLKVGSANITVSLEGANSTILTVNVIENPFATAQKGDEVEFGRYPQTASGEIQSIKWIVLTRDDENKKLLAISVDGLDAHRFDDDSNVWADSEIRQWLNGDGFYNRVLDDGTNVFTDGEKSLIKPVVLADVDMTEEDNVFLLSTNEAQNTNYFADNSATKCKPTAYAISNGAWVSTSESYAGNCHWGLRSPNPNYDNNPDYANDVYYVNDVGYIYSNGVDKDGCSVRPAIWIKL